MAKKVTVATTSQMYARDYTPYHTGNWDDIRMLAINENIVPPRSTVDFIDEYGAGEADYIELEAKFFNPTGAGFGTNDFESDASGSFFNVQNMMDGLPASGNSLSEDETFVTAVNCHMSFKIEPDASYQSSLLISQELLNSLEPPRSGSRAIVHNLDKTKVREVDLVTTFRGFASIIFKQAFPFGGEFKLGEEDIYYSHEDYQVTHLPDLVQVSSSGYILTFGADPGLSVGDYVTDGTSEIWHEVTNTGPGTNQVTIYPASQFNNPTGIDYQLYKGTNDRPKSIDINNWFWEKNFDFTRPNDNQKIRFIGKAPQERAFIVYPKAGEDTYQAIVANKFKDLQNNNRYYAVGIDGRSKLTHQLSQTFFGQAFHAPGEVKIIEQKQNLHIGDGVRWGTSLTSFSSYHQFLFRNNFYEETEFQSTNVDIIGSHDNGTDKILRPLSSGEHYRAVQIYKFRANPYNPNLITVKFIIEGFVLPTEGNNVLLTYNQNHTKYGGTSTLLNPGVPTGATGPTGVNVDCEGDEFVTVQLKIHNVPDEIDQLVKVPGSISAQTNNCLLLDTRASWEEPNINNSSQANNYIVSQPIRILPTNFGQDYSCTLETPIGSHMFKGSISGTANHDFGLQVFRTDGATRLNSSTRQHRIVGQVSGFITTPVSITNTQIPGLNELVNDGTWHFTINNVFSTLYAEWDYVNKRILLERQPISVPFGYWYTAGEYYDITVLRT